jgi:hypothetical protein
MNPDQVKFSNSPVEATAADSELVIFRSELSEYNPSSNKFVRINLPVADKAWIDFSDTTISLQLTNRSHNTSSASATTTAVKTQLSNLIKSVTFLNSQGEQIEYINNYNLVNNIMDDYMVGKDHKEGVSQILSGGSNDGNPDNAVGINGSATTSEADGSSLTLVDTLMTGITNAGVMLPLGYLVGQSPAIILELEDPNTALKIATAANAVCAYKVTNVQIRAKQIRFSSTFNQGFEAKLAEAGMAGLNYITTSYLHNQAQLANGVSGLQNVPFSSNPRSAQYILACMRKETSVTAIDEYSLGTRVSAGADQYSWEISGKQYPSQPIELSDTNYAQGFSNVLDALGAIGAVNRNTLISTSGTNTRFYSATAATASKFVAALPLEDFNSSSNPSVYSGANLSVVGQMAFRPKLAGAISGSHRVDFFTAIDMSLHVTADGRMYSVK